MKLKKIDWEEFGFGLTGYIGDFVVAHIHYYPRDEFYGGDVYGVTIVVPPLFGHGKAVFDNNLFGEYKTKEEAKEATLKKIKEYINLFVE